MFYAFLLQRFSAIFLSCVRAPTYRFDVGDTALHASPATSKTAAYV